MENFIKEWWIASWSAFNRFVQPHSAFKILSWCTIIARPQSCKCLPIFDLKKCYSLSSPLYSTDLSPPDYFLFPKLKMKLKGLHPADIAEIQEAITDGLKKVQKEEFSASLQKMYNHAKACIYANSAYFELKKRYVHMIFKKISPKTFGPQCVYSVCNTSHSLLNGFNKNAVYSVNRMTADTGETKYFSFLPWKLMCPSYVYKKIIIQ